MDHQKAKRKRQLRRRRHVRRNITGTSERPRLSVFRSSKHIYAQLIDDLSGATLAAASSRSKGKDVPYGGNVKAAAGVGKQLAEVAKGKANEVRPAGEKASKDAQETMRRQRRIQVRGETIPHRVIGRFGGSRVVMVPAGPGTGVKAGPGVRDVLEACGIRNILTKTHGSTNPINLVKATIRGLLMLRTREEVARLRGVTL